MDKMEEEELLTGPTFSPPLYQQRYSVIVDLIKANNVKRVLDAGCSEGKLLTHIKIHSPSIEEIIGVDIDQEVLSLNKFRLKPLMAEYLFKRNTKLRMALYQGSITEPDILFRNFDFLACVEVIEHLPEKSLAAFPAAIFGVLNPGIVAITTPNAEFNVLFHNFSGFRHPDHKFEWTRAEFRSWCLNCSQVYGYSVEFSCIGFGPTGTESLGGCTQMAVFKRITDRSEESLSNKVQTGSFMLISDVTYPYQPAQSTSEKLMIELRYLINNYFSLTNQYAIDDCSLVREVPLNVIMEYRSIQSLGVDINMLREVAKEDFDLTEDGNSIVVKFQEDDDNSLEDETTSDNEERSEPTQGIASEDEIEDFWD